MKPLIQTAVMATLLSFAAIAAASNGMPIPVVTVVNEIRIPLLLDVPNSYYVLSPDAQGAEVFFDASASYDPDGDQLLFSWGGGLTTDPTTSGHFGSEDYYEMELVVSDGSNVVVQKFTLLVVLPDFMVHEMSNFLWREEGNPKALYPLARMLNRSAEAYEELDFNEGTRFLHAFSEQLNHETLLSQDVRGALAKMAEIIINAVKATSN